MTREHSREAAQRATVRPVREGTRSHYAACSRISAVACNVLRSTPVRSLYLGANFASVVRPIPAGPGQTLPGGRFRCRNARNKFFAARFAHFFIIKVPGVRPGFPTLHYGLTPMAPRGRIWRKSPISFRTHPSRLPHHWGWYMCHWGGSGTFL